jgi:hypothetical protein
MSKQIKILITILGIIILLVLITISDELRYLYCLLLLISGTITLLYTGVPVLLIQTQPAQSMYAKVVNKRRKDETTTQSGYATFEFQDGTEKEFKIGINFKTLRKNDTGTLTYKEAKNGEGKDYHHRYFISFEKDNPNNK